MYLFQYFDFINQSYRKVWSCSYDIKFCYSTKIILLYDVAEPLIMLQVQLGTHSFTFDHVYGSSGTPPSAMFEECVSPLVDGLFQGYNATVLAYGQV